MVFKSHSIHSSDRLEGFELAVPRQGRQKEREAARSRPAVHCWDIRRVKAGFSVMLCTAGTQARYRDLMFPHFDIFVVVFVVPVLISFKGPSLDQVQVVFAPLKKLCPCLPADCIVEELKWCVCA